MPRRVAIGILAFLGACVSPPRLAPPVVVPAAPVAAPGEPSMADAVDSLSAAIACRLLACGGEARLAVFPPVSADGTVSALGTRVADVLTRRLVDRDLGGVAHTRVDAFDLSDGEKVRQVVEVVHGTPSVTRNEGSMTPARLLLAILPFIAASCGSHPQVATRDLGGTAVSRVAAAPTGREARYAVGHGSKPGDSLRPQKQGHAAFRFAKTSKSRFCVQPAPSGS